MPVVLLADVPPVEICMKHVAERIKLCVQWLNDAEDKGGYCARWIRQYGREGLSRTMC